jgi:uroporphyrinogen decarboxylase
MSIAGDNNVGLDELFRDGKLMADLHLGAQREFGHDIVHLQNGVASVSEALGCQIECFHNVPPAVRRSVIHDVRDWGQLNRPDFSKSGTLIAELIKATRIVVEKSGKSVFVRAEAECGPFTLAGEMMGVENFLMQVADPERRTDIHALVDFLTEVVTDFCLAQANAGAHLVGIGDPLAGPDLLSPKDYKEFAYPYQKRLVNNLKGKGIDLVIHMCGDITKIFRQVASTGAMAVELDYKVDADECRKLDEDICIIGNIDPSGILALGTPEEVRSKCKSAIRVLGLRGHFILGPGCDLPYKTPKANIHALMDVAKTFGNYHEDLLDM